MHDRAERIEELERDAEAILESYARMTPDALDNLTPEERHRFYRMLGLKATVGADGSVELDGTFIVDGPLEIGEAFGGSEGGREPVSTKATDKRSSNPDADHIGGFLDVFEVGVLYVSGDPKGTLTYNSFLRGLREEGSEVEVVRSERRLDWGGVQADVIAPPPGELFSETNDNSVAILLSYGTARILLAGDAEAKEEEYMANGPYTGPLTVINVPKLHTVWAKVPRPAGRRNF